MPPVPFSCTCTHPAPAERAVRGPVEEQVAVGLALVQGQVQQHQQQLVLHQRVRHGAAGRLCEVEARGVGGESIDPSIHQSKARQTPGLTHAAHQADVVPGVLAVEPLRGAAPAVDADMMAAAAAAGAAPCGGLRDRRGRR